MKQVMKNWRRTNLRQKNIEWNKYDLLDAPRVLSHDDIFPRFEMTLLTIELFDESIFQSFVCNDLEITKRSIEC